MRLKGWIGAGKNCGTTGGKQGFLGSLCSLGMTVDWGVLGSE